MNCYNCGKEIKKSYKICPYCGEPNTGENKENLKEKARRSETGNASFFGIRNLEKANEIYYNLGEDDKIIKPHWKKDTVKNYILNSQAIKFLLLWFLISSSDYHLSALGYVISYILRITDSINLGSEVIIIPVYILISGILYFSKYLKKVSIEYFINYLVFFELFSYLFRNLNYWGDIIRGVLIMIGPIMTLIIIGIVQKRYIFKNRWKSIIIYLFLTTNISKTIPYNDNSLISVFICLLLGIIITFIIFYFLKIYNFLEEWEIILFMIFIIGFYYVNFFSLILGIYILKEILKRWNSA